MFKSDFEEFKKLCGQGNMIPICHEMLADLETPVSVLSRFAAEEHVALLESIEGGKRWGRYSVIGIRPFGIFQVRDGVPTFETNGEVEILDASAGAFFALRRIMNRYKIVDIPDMPRFYAGSLGYLGYNAIAEFEELPGPRKALTEPTAYFMLFDQAVIFDNIRHTMRLIVCANLEKYPDPRQAFDIACAEIEKLRKRLAEPVQIMDIRAEFNMDMVKSNMTEEYFCEMAARARERIVAGDIIQVVLSQRFSTPQTIPALQLYRALRLVNPSPYMFFLKTGGGKYLIGSSPEVMVRLNNGKAELRPIAGTRPRGDTDAADRDNTSALLSDEKERAEHLMLVDLGRNDLGRVAQPASVQVREFMIIEKYSHVMHLVSNVECVLKPGMDAFDLIRSTFPAGTLSGAPKISAMKIINELEPEPREIYGGCVGYISFNGNMDMAITIRTMELRDGMIYVQAGGGHVYDSEPEYEYRETRHKARALFRALELAAANLEL